MGGWGFRHYVGSMFLCVLLLPVSLMASVLRVGNITPGFQGSQMTYIDKDGLFLRSNNSGFGFGFVTTPNDVTLFILSIVHTSSSREIWSANRASPVSNSDKFAFEENGNVVLQKGGTVVWKLDNSGKGASAMELRDSGNLVVVGNDGNSIWESFDHPTDTLITSQEFKEGMKLTSDPSSDNVSYVLEIKSGDAVLSVSSPTPQVYWSMGSDQRKIINKDGKVATSSSLVSNSWRFYDQSKVLLWQFIFSDSNKDENSTWIAVLGNNGVISFYFLGDGVSASESSTKVPQDQCATPEPCGPYLQCSGSKVCECVSGLSRLRSDCRTGISSPCKKSNNSQPVELINSGDGLDYFALKFVSPSSKTDLDGCKASCSGNCSCLGLFFENSTGNCFLFDWLGSFRNSDKGTGFVSYIKVASNGITTDEGEDGGKHFPYIVIIVVVTVCIIVGLIFFAVRFHRRRKKLGEEAPQESSEEDNFLENLSGMPIRFTYKDLQSATNNFLVKLGQGGFGSVYQGFLPDGTRIAVKKLEGIGQGKKEFRAEVSIIGSIHHLHLVRLKGFCAEGTHRMLAYEFMAKGSLDKWIFRKQNGDFLLDWDTRFNIALGTAKGLAYLHEDCDVRIVHCDIKPENILLDDNFLAKVSDFGLAKLMTREQSHVFTTLRGTRGYLAPEWITNYAISEKSDVYSYGMVLLEIIGGRKNYDPSETSEKCHFPSYAFKMMEEGKILEIVDSKMKNVDVEDDERVQRALKVALWCIQEDMHLRPSMSRVVQMLEGVSPVVQPPPSSTLGSRLYSSFFKSLSEEGGTSSGPSDCNSDTYLSAVRLSGPR
ncbi:PREDICTED: G-type lectin S-receptor-like serine/threonine-protein kinase SD2-5 [Tarenaya hassleriana]|uniref:G-type lectin S-receptor-like serine/threonine-protein kinase SD2-5 n=1 Tax=Tarenaya hassleriana TaxID=28532 RepID=UPI00053C1A8F|nr:PREDICTED: G-type lectin S-receptor-like serine/threonine-protein kinase SD2-5 [Tarenaya hassleriana]